MASHMLTPCLLPPGPEVCEDENQGAQISRDYSRNKMAGFSDLNYFKESKTLKNGSNTLKA